MLRDKNMECLLYFMLNFWVFLVSVKDLQFEKAKTELRILEMDLKVSAENVFSDQTSWWIFDKCYIMWNIIGNENTHHRRYHESKQKNSFFFSCQWKNYESSGKNIRKWHPVKGGIQSKQTFLCSSIVILGLQSMLSLLVLKVCTVCMKMILRWHRSCNVQCCWLSNNLCLFLKWRR